MPSFRSCLLSFGLNFWIYFCEFFFFSISRMQIFPASLPLLFFNLSVMYNCPWDLPGKNTAVGFNFLLPGILWIQGSSLHLLLSRRILYHWARPGYLAKIEKKKKSPWFWWHDSVREQEIFLCISRFFWLP